MPTANEELLRGVGLRVTAGRLAVLHTLEGMPHSDAESLHRALEAAGDRLTLQAVHNVLGDLTAAGLLRRIEPARSPARYERRIGDNHHHVVCTECGVVGDVDCAVGHTPCLTPSDSGGFAITTAEVTFWGVCSACSAAQPATAS